MTRIKDPKRSGQHHRQILFILITSNNAGFMALSWLREPGCPGGAPGAQERGPRGAERSPGGAGQGWARIAGRIGGWLRGCSQEPPAPGRGVEGAGLLWKCGDAWTRRLRAVAPSRGSSSPLRRRRLRSRRRPPLPPHGPGDWGASGDADGGAAAAAAAAALAAVAVGPAPSLLSKGYFIALQ